MKKSLTIIASILILMLSVGTALADSTSGSTATVNFNGGTSSNGEFPATIIFPGRMTGNNTFAPQPLFFLTPADETLPGEVAGDWTIAIPTEKEKITVEMLKEGSVSVKTAVMKTGIKATTLAVTKDNQTELVRLKYWPVNTQPVAIAQGTLDDKGKVVFSAEYKAWLKAYEESGSLHYIVLLNKELVSQAVTDGVGGTIGGGILAAATKGLGIAIGGEHGSAESSTFRKAAFMVVAFASAGEMPSAYAEKLKYEEEKNKIDKEEKWLELEERKARLAERKRRLQEALTPKETAKPVQTVKQEKEVKKEAKKKIAKHVPVGSGIISAPTTTKVEPEGIMLASFIDGVLRGNGWILLVILLIIIAMIAAYMRRSRLQSPGPLIAKQKYKTSD